MKTYRFTALIHGDPHQNIAFVEFPFDVEKEFGCKGRIKVQVTFDGHPYRGSLVRMGRPCHWIGLTKAVRQAIGKKPGDTVGGVLQPDTAPRTGAPPPELAERLKNNPAAATFFSTLSFTHQKEYVRWITEAKKQETRRKRLDKTVEMLLDHIKHP